jgi:hypothetical protein
MCCCSLYSVLPCVSNPWSPSNANSNCMNHFSVVPGFEFRAFHLLDRCSTISVTSRPFFCCISQIGSHIFAQGQPQTVILLSVSYITGITCVYHNAQLLIEMGVYVTFYPGWPQTAILPISASKQLGLQAQATIPSSK